MDDLISRQGAIDAVEKESRVDGAYGYMDTKSIVDLLNDLPSVQPGIIRCRDYKWSDLINRKSVLKALRPIMRKSDYFYEIQKAIQDIPSAQPEQRWIPCSERLPEEAGTYLCTCVNAERWMVTLIKWQPRMRSWNLTGARAYWKVVAWKPLPEPYQEGEQDD